MEIWSAAITLFLIMDPLGNLPIFTSILRNVPVERHRPIIIRELLIALFVMMLFLFLGESILAVMRLKAEAVSIAGGIILFIIAIRMIFPAPKKPMDDDTSGEEPFIVPLAVPLIAGPSLLASLMLLANRKPDMTMYWLLAVVGAWAVSALILLGAPRVVKVLGQRGLMACERLMGMILVMLSVQMLLDGLSNYLSHTV